MTATKNAAPQTTALKFAYLLMAAILLLLTWRHTATVTLDDAYITYRYADNLAQHGSLFYNESGPSQLFATTAPVYAVLLAGFGAVGADIPTVGGWLSILAMIVAAVALADLLAAWHPWGGIIAGVTLAAFPMGWLVLGMEGLPSLALVLLGFALSRRGRDGWAALALAAATLLRFDAAAGALAWGVWLLMREGWRSAKVWRAAAVYLVTVVAVYAALMLLLGVPLPSTLGTKRAQVSLGITGFYPDTTYLKGLWLLAKAYWLHSPWYGVMALFALIGLATALQALRKREGRAWFIASPFLVLLLWTVFHLALYTALGVTPYVWYYLPVAPLLAALCALGFSGLVWLAGRSRYRLARDFAPLALGLALLIGPFATHALMDQRTRGAELGEPAPAQTLADKALPGAQYPAYRPVGEWLAANTPVTATVGVTEVGIMGYYSRRPMLDFLGLLDADVSEALSRRDMAWGVYARQPDIIALSSVNPAFAYDAYIDPWFQANYTPVQTVAASGFWGGDMTIYRRNTRALPYGPVREVPSTATPLQYRFGDALELVGIEAQPGPWHGGEAVGVTLYWRVLKQPERAYGRIAHLIDADGRAVAGSDQTPLFDQLPTTNWQAGQLLADFEPIGLPPLPAAPTTLTWEIIVHDPEKWMRLPAYGPDGAELPDGALRLEAAELLPGLQTVILASDDCRIAIGGYQLGGPKVVREGRTSLTVDVSDVGCPVSLTAEVWDWVASRVVWEQTVDVVAPGKVEFAMTAAPGDPATWPELRLRAEAGGQRLLMRDSAGHAVGDALKLTPIELTGP